MSQLSDLGLAGPPGPLMLVSPPDAVLAEAGRMKPRPSFASSIMTAEPTAHIAWWPEAEHLGEAALARLAWLIGTEQTAVAWLILDERGGLPPVAAVTALLADTGLSVKDERALGDRVTALHVTLNHGADQ